MSITVAIVGAGSIGFTRDMVRDILCVPEFRDADIRLTDINARNLDMVYRLLKRDIAAAKLPARLTATQNRRAAFKGANYVFCVVRVGGLEGFATDIDIPLKYGVDQCVGDTLAPGGIMYGQRTIPVLLDFCQDIAEVAAPGCLFMNYSNPMAMNTWACAKYGGVKMIGLCHGVSGGHKLIAEAFGLEQDEVDIVCAGINHQTWYVSIKHKGEDLTGKLLAAFEKDPEIARNEKVRIDMLRRFGYFSTECNGHLSEYVPWYRKRLDEIPNWIDLSSWINGETGGYLRVCTEGRNWFEHDFPNWMKDAAVHVPARGPRPRARLVHHRGAGDRPDLPRPLQRGEPRRHHQPARRLHRRGAGLRGRQRHQHPRRRRPAPGVRRGVQRQRLRPAPGGRGGGARRRPAAAPGIHDGPADRRGAQSRPRSGRWSTTC